MAEKKKEHKAGEYFLRASSKHPARRYRIGRHDIGAQCKKFVLNEAEAKELGTDGPRKWVEICDERTFKADTKIFEKQKDVPGFGQGLKEEV